jgi:hypothetical protein
MGRRRRAVAGDKMLHFWRKTRNAADAAARDMRNRAVGTTEEIRSRFRDQPVSDDVMVERVRSKMGRVTSHPSAITVTCAEGCVTLSGPVLSNEAGALLRCVNKVKGVKSVDNRLQLHDSAEGVAALQGGSTLSDRGMAGASNRWIMLGATGGALAAYGFARRTPNHGRFGIGRLPVWAKSHLPGYKRMLHPFH